MATRDLCGIVWLRITTCATPRRYRSASLLPGNASISCEGKAQELSYQRPVGKARA